MAGDKDIQAQDQAHKVQGYCAVVDDNMGCGYCARRYEIGVKKKTGRKRSVFYRHQSSTTSNLWNDIQLSSELSCSSI